MATTVRDILRRLHEAGWSVVRQRGSHRQLQHPTNPATITVAGKPSANLHPKIVATILRQTGLDRET